MADNFEKRFPDQMQIDMSQVPDIVCYSARQLQQWLHTGSPPAERNPNTLFTQTLQENGAVQTKMNTFA
eukprot:5288639-Amphidinium_carterae.1